MVIIFMHAYVNGEINKDKTQIDQNRLPNSFNYKWVEFYLFL